VHRTWSICWRAAVVAAGLSLLTAACGDDDDDSASSTESPGSDAGAGKSPPGGSTDTDTDGGLSSAGGAVAARGAGLSKPPGPTSRTPLPNVGEVAIAIRNPDGSVKGWCVLLAETMEQRERGLMEVTDLGGYAGMLFVWDADSTSSFYMRNTPTPLSIAWVDSGGKLVSTADMAPCGDVPTCPLYPAKGPYRFALEVPKGDLAKLGLTEGSTLAVGGSCA
jgi:uncharacterized membrane protein (UPF0127 family)